MPQVRNLVFLSLLVCCFALSACAVRNTSSAAAPEATIPANRTAFTYQGAPFLRTELFFGLSVQNTDGSDTEITEQQWREFLDREVTPRFPDGLTVLDCRGQWRHNGRIVREKSKVLYLLHPLPKPGESDAADQKIEKIRSIYKERFHQDSVLRVTQPADVSF